MLSKFLLKKDFSHFDHVNVKNVFYRCAQLYTLYFKGSIVETITQSIERSLSLSKQERKFDLEYCLHVSCLDVYSQMNSESRQNVKLAIFEKKKSKIS